MRTLAKRIAIGLVLSMVAVCSAEVPTWDEVEARLYVIRRHWWGRTTPQHDGIWLFDRQSATYQRLRPFHFNSQAGNQVPRERDGFGSFFAGADGLLVFQAWPYYLDFEVGSLRLLRRYPPLEDPASAGWVVQGPVLARPVADALGLEPGVYGFGTCHRQLLTSGRESPNIRCDSYDFPGWSPDVWYYPDGDPAVLLRRSTGPEGGDVDMAARVVQHFAGIEVPDELRVNVGLFNGDHDHPIVHRLILYAADGALAAETTLTLEPLASLQQPLHQLFSLDEGGLADGTYGLTVLPLDDDEAGVEGRSWAWVSVIDNVTGDPTNWW